jgi:hypothetical protein
MRHENDRLPEPLNAAAKAYNNPPELTRAELDDLWSAIERDAFPRRLTPPGGDGREQSRDSGWYSIRRLLPLAAVLLLGIGIGRFGAPRTQATLPFIAEGIRALPAADSVTLPEPYQSTTSQYLGQTAALLVSLPAEVRAGRADEQLLGRAHDLLLTTRLLLDSPASADPRIRTLFEDLELVLAQIVRLQTQQSREELDLIRQALEQRDVLPRLRSAVADISADD